MKPAAFEYHRPGTIEAALGLLTAHGDEAALLAGGQSLVPMMNMRLARPAQLIDINRLRDFASVTRAGQMLEIGALIRHADLARDPVVGQHCPLLARAASTIGHYAIRQRGTLGGSLAMADPAAQLPLVAALLGAEIVLQSERGERGVASDAFFFGAMTTDAAEDEMITAIRVPCREEGETFGFRLFAPRAGDFAIALCAASVTRDGAGDVRAARIALGGITGAPLVLTEMLAAHIDRATAPNWPATVAAEIASSIEPEGDGRFDATYKRELASALIAQTLSDALDADGRAAA